MAYEDKSLEDKAHDYIHEYKSWKEDLRPYWTQIKKNQELYEDYKSEMSETAADVSLNTAFSMVESMVARANEATLNVNVDAKGNNGLSQFEDYVSEIVREGIEDPDVARYVSSFRKNKEVWTRDLLVKGNSVGESQYVYKTGLDSEEQKKVLADNPCFKPRSLFSLVFDPSGPMDESERYYLEKNVSFSSLRKQERKEVEEEVKGVKTKRSEGMYFNLDELKMKMEKEEKVVDHTDQDFISGDQKIRRKIHGIKLIERWEGPKLCVIAITNSEKDDGLVIREEYDPLKIGTHPFLLGMRYKTEGRPYARGEIDAIYKPTRAQDTVLNQGIESVNRYLRPGFLIKDPQADLDAIMTLIESGGVTYGDPQGLGPIQADPPPAQAFQLHELLQQGIERAARYSPYASGVPNQATDKTAGTATGITRLQQASEPNFKTILDDIQEALVMPYGQMVFKMIANLMGENEIRYGLLKGKNPGWVKATKGILQGKATIGDMVTVGFITEEELNNPEFIQNLVGELGVEPSLLFEETVAFDTDWIITVHLDDQTEADKMQKTQQEIGYLNLGLQIGVPINPEKAWLYGARKQGMEEVEDLLFSPEEQQAQQEQQMAQMQQQEQMAQQSQEQQLNSQMQQKQMDLQSKDQLQQRDIESRLMQEQLRGANQNRVAQLRRPAGVR